MNLIHSVDDKCYIGQNYYFSMKKILFRKILLDCFLFFIISLISTSIIIFIFQAVNFLDIMIEDGRNYFVYFNYTLLSFPKIMSRILPFAMFFSFSYVLVKYEMNNELIVYWTHGVKKIDIINFFLKFSFLLVFFQLLFTSYIVPRTQEISRELVKNSSIDFVDSFIKPKKFNDNIKDLTIYTDDKDDQNNLKNIYLKKGSNKNFQVTFAKKGIIKIKKNISVLTLYDGRTINRSNDKITNFKFSESDFNLNNFNTNTITIIKTQETSTFALFNCINNFLKKKIIEQNNSITNSNCSIKNMYNIYKEIYKRLILPFYLPILIIIASMHILETKEKINFTKYRIYLFLSGIFVIIFSESMLKLINDNYLLNFQLIFFPVIIFISLYFYVFYKLKSYKF